MQDHLDPTEHFETVVIGGGQAGLAVGHELASRGRSFVILDAHPRVGDAWRRRWDSLLLFTPARYAGLPGRRQPVSGGAFLTKDAMADYLEDYARHFDLPVRTNTRVDRLCRDGDPCPASSVRPSGRGHKLGPANSDRRWPRQAGVSAP